MAEATALELRTRMEIIYAIEVEVDVVALWLTLGPLGGAASAAIQP